MKATQALTHREFAEAGHGALFLWRFAEKGRVAGHMMIKCPGCGRASAMHVRAPGVPHPADMDSWLIKFDNNAITLEPSISHATENGGCGWHGWLREGVYNKC
jgi:hypothetical protein